MKKTQVFCDDCTKQILNPDKQLLSDGCKFDQDICDECVKARLRQSFKDYKVGSLTCHTCNNTKTIKVRDGYNNDYELRTEYKTISCPDCTDGVKLKK